MSRIGKKVIEIPKTVTVVVQEESETQKKNITVKGKFGTLERKISTDTIHFENSENTIQLTRVTETKKAREYHGLIRVLIQNMITGVDQQFSKTLVAEGVGYKFQLEKNILLLSVGFTHIVKFEIPSDLTVKLESPTKMSIFGIDKEKVGFFTSKIRAMRPPEPYKGKGLLYEGEKIIRKVGKTGK